MNCFTLALHNHFFWFLLELFFFFVCVVQNWDDLFTHRCTLYTDNYGNLITIVVRSCILWRYGYHQRENTGSCLFTEVKPCWTGLISGWVTISMKYPVLYSLGSQAGVVDINHAFHLYYNVVCVSSFSRSQPDFKGFLRALQFPPSAKLTPSVIQYAGPHW